MTYYITRAGQRYGPYSLEDLQAMSTKGQILPTDLAWSEGLSNWVPVSQVLGNIPFTAPPLPQPPAPPAGPPYPGFAATSPSGAGVPTVGAATAPSFGGYAPPPASAQPGRIPPSLHWALVLLLSLVTCGIFHMIWMFVEASFVKKLRPDCKAVMMYAIGLVMYGIALVAEFARAFASGLAGAVGNSEFAVLTGLLSTVGPLAYIVLFQIGNFSIKNCLEDYYNSEEPIQLRLSGVMTFFFNVLYFQYHFSRIAAWKRTGYIQPQ